MSAPMPNDGSFRRDERGRALELPPALRANIWTKGNAPNPAGKSGLYHQTLKLCRDASAASIAELIRLRDNSDDERVRYMAATWLYERAWGKVKDYDPKADQDQNRPRFDPNALSPDQLALVEHALRLMMQATRAPVSAEAEVTEVEAEEIVESGEQE